MQTVKQFMCVLQSVQLRLRTHNMFQYVINYSLHADCSLKCKNYKKAITVVYVYDNVVNIPYNTNYSLRADHTL